VANAWTGVAMARDRERIPLRYLRACAVSVHRIVVITETAQPGAHRVTSDRFGQLPPARRLALPAREAVTASNLVHYPARSTGCRKQQKGELWETYHHNQRPSPCKGAERCQSIGKSPPTAAATAST
jgi:hypothetical protein